MVAKFLDVNKSKRHLKSGFALFQTSLTLFNLPNVGEVSWVESERTVSKFRKRKKIGVVLTYSIKRAIEIRKFHVAVVQQWPRNQKKA